ncbi:MAG: 16S rRNA (cytidine(1402)-2'-O)-methyltransferase [Pseudomonadota bacterium]
MNFEKRPLPAGLYLVSTPIGTARDITLRALDILASADLLVAEDTRTLRKLMDLHGIPLEGRRVMSYHDHSSKGDRARIVEAVMGGQSVAYASEAGTPLIADPGFGLVADVREAGGLVTAAPGPSAAITALSLAGLPTDAFHFAGFLPASSAARQKALAALASLAATLVIYEAPGRVGRCLADCARMLGDARQAALCRELTKRFEEVRRGTLGALLADVEAKPPKGECVILIAKSQEKEMGDGEILEALKGALTNRTVKDAVAVVAGSFGVPRRQVYQMALELQKSEGDG